MSNSLWTHGLQHARPPCPSPSPRVCSNSCPFESVMPSNHFISCCPLLLLPSIIPSIRWELTQKKPLEYKTQHNPTTSSTLCRTPHLSNKQNKIKKNNYQLTSLPPHSALPIGEKQTNKQKLSTVSPHTKLTQATGQTLGRQRPKGRKKFNLLQEKNSTFLEAWEKKTLNTIS